MKGAKKSAAVTETFNTKPKADPDVDPVTGLVADGEATETEIPVKWTAPASGADSYEVTANGKTESVTGTSHKVSGLEAGKPYPISVVAVKGAKKSAAVTETFNTKAKPGDITPPSDPTDVTNTVAGSTVNLTWSPSKDEDGGSGLAGYYVYQNGQRLGGLVTETKKAVSGLAAGTYDFEVSAVDKANNESKKVKTTATVPPPVGGSTYGLAGTSTIKGANGKVALNGAVTTTVEGGKVSADLTLNPTTGNFSIFGFLPATASIAFAPEGKTTGTLSGSTLTTETKTIVKVPSVKVFGIQIGGGATCQTSTAATIPLKSTDFKLGSGGTLKGNYTLPALKGCGPLTPIISAFVAGSGNTVDLKATAK
ncbi:fibronectin type III domain-containing protein [Actinomadura fulvescens]|uniref:fibronectin type III domain-containing protein n=1 Tax=Actinomadura fulvescens TaxID=46160 RepID=UPI0031DC4447